MTASVHSLADARAAKVAAATKAPPAWANDLEYCCLYARVLRAEHDAEEARLKLERLQRGVKNVYEDEELGARTDANHLEWDVYHALILHLAELPAKDRRIASIKRRTIGNMWLRAEGERYDRIRAGCEQDDHLFPPSAQMRRKRA